MALTITRNPNLTLPQTSAKNCSQSENEIQKRFGALWWTGVPPSQCRGFDRERNCLVALPQLNLQIASRQDILEYFDNTWTLTEVLFAGLKTEEAYTRPPYHQLRHPMIFYYGHPAVLFINKLRLAGLQTESLNLYLEKVLETGVDEMSWDDLSKNEMNWPSVEAVHEYRQRVYGIISELIKTHPDLDKGVDRLTKSPLWALWMGFEHEKIHFETSSVLIRELPTELVETPAYFAPLHPSRPATDHFKPVVGKDFELTSWKTQKGERVEMGKPWTVPSYGWDNEYGHREAQLHDFQFTDHQITNGEYLEFVKGAYVKDEFWSDEGLAWRKFRNTKRPTFWAAVGPEGSHEYELRTIFQYIPMPWNWPVEVNFHEAQAYCRWKNLQDKSPLYYRLLTEAEFNSLRGRQVDPVLQNRPYRDYNDFAEFKANFNFIWSSPAPVSSEVSGNTWHWIEDQFNPLPGFSVHPLYDDFSTPCFDGKHQIILGGSFISCGQEASHWARFHFRPHFNQHSGFRMAASLNGSRDNESIKLNLSETYLHPRRENVLDQMAQKKDWWKQVEQPLELRAEEFENLFAVTQEKIAQFEKNYAQMSPMGSAHDVSLNSVPVDFSLPYQTTKNFPSQPTHYEKLLQFIFEEMAPLSQLPGHPGYAAYVAGSGNMISNLAQLVSQTLNPFSGHYMMAPGLVTLEAEVIQWFINLMKFPDTSGGFLTTGSSLATQSALAMARQKKVQGQNYARLTIYISDQAHHCVSKAWAILGFAPENIRFVPTSRPDFRLQISELEKALQKDVSEGFQPLCIVGSAGTTNTGAVDPLLQMAELAKKYQAWFHVDGAYGALFQMTEKAKALLQGLEKADSLVFDLHKALGLSYGTGCLLLRDKKDMHFDYPGAKTYMPPSPGENAQDLRVDYADISPELSRDYRGLRVWLPLKVFGIGPFTLNLEEKLKLSEWFCDEIKKNPKLEVIASPQLSIQAFAVKISSDLQKNNEATQKLLESINRRGTLFLSSCTLDGRQAIRICLLGFRMHYERLRQALEEINQLV